jgi:acetyltransferase-like isoleucine patch superfamily enzyme
MLRALGSGRAALHHPIDMAESEPSAMRIFEATGMGCALFVQNAPRLSNYFSPGDEIIAYGGVEELVERLSHYAANPSEMAAIAARGQARCFRDHSMDDRASRLDRLLRQILSSGSGQARLGTVRTESVEELFRLGVEKFEAGSFDEALAIAERAKTCGRAMIGLDHLRAAALIRLDRRSEGIEALRAEVSNFPDNIEATRSLAELAPIPVPPAAVSSAPTGASTRSDLEKRFAGVAFGTDIQILGVSELQIGTGSVVQDGTWINVCCRDGRSRIRIGLCVCVGRWNVLSTAGQMEIGDYCLFGPNVYISDTDHIFSDPMRPYASQGVRTGGTIVIEENCWFGKNVTIQGSITVGRGTVVGAHSLVLSNVEPFYVVVGTPARVVKMYDPVHASWLPAAAEEQREAIRANRRTHPLPDRETYRGILRKSGFSSIDPVAAGSSQNI